MDRTSTTCRALKEITMSNVIEGDLPEFMENTDENLFVTGKAGCGKSICLLAGWKVLLKDANISAGGSTPLHPSMRLPSPLTWQSQIPGRHLNYPKEPVRFQRVFLSVMDVAASLLGHGWVLNTRAD